MQRKVQLGASFGFFRKLTTNFVRWLRSTHSNTRIIVLPASDSISRHYHRRAHMFQDIVNKQPTVSI